MTKIYILVLLSIVSVDKLFAQTPIGTWITIDDETGKEKSYVEVFERGNRLHGKIVKLLLKPQNSVCTVCDGVRKNKPLVGMVILSDMQKKGNRWEGGKIYKADAGKEYDGNIKMDGPNTLIVTGKVLFFSKSQTWKRLQTLDF